VDSRLRRLTGRAPELLSESQTAFAYPQRRFVAGWRIAVTFSDKIVRYLDVVASNRFPDAPVRTALVDRPEFLAWPHVEEDGVLCLLPNMAECDPDDPGGVAENLFVRSVRLIEELIQGDIIERDLREEFLTYWAYATNAGPSRLHSLLDPHPVSRLVRVWPGQDFTLLAESDEVLRFWLHNRFGQPRPKAAKAEAGVFLWLSEPLLPAAYPETAADLRTVAEEYARDGVALLDQIASTRPARILAVLAAQGRNGAGLTSVIVPAPTNRAARTAFVAEPLTRGFRPRSLPADLASRRYFGSEPVVRSSIFRADPPWIHGRGQDPRAARLLQSQITIAGCGSVGAPIAVGLAQAGVGRIDLVDHDELAWANVGRHPLGATSVGENKALALAAHLQREFPHLSITGHATDVQALISGDPGLLQRSDLILSATGSWAAESALNRWHLTQGRTMPIVYGWTEAHACAGHAVAIVAAGGCLQCGIEKTGVPLLQVTSWRDGAGAVMEEPACGAHYQPYGPIELGHINNLIAELALDCLLGTVQTALHRIWAARKRLLDEAGGSWTADWQRLAGGRPEGGFILERLWLAMPCTKCAKALAA
jgi:hypothetical protein